MSVSKTSKEVRASLVEALDLDLIGPWPGHALEREKLNQVPSRWYLTGFLVPSGAGREQRSEETSAEEVDQVSNVSRATDDAAPPEPASARRAYFPSSIGLSVLIPPETQSLSATVSWGDYSLPTTDKSEQHQDLSGKETGEGAVEEPWVVYSKVWTRTPRQEQVNLDVRQATSQPVEYDVPKSGGLKVLVSVRPMNLPGQAAWLVPPGTRAVSVFVVNRRAPKEDESKDEAFAFQVELELKSEKGLVPRPNLQGLNSNDWDERVADLQYRDAYEFAVGHGVATRAERDPDGHCRTVRTCWMPRGEVERVAPAPVTGVELGMEALSAVADGAQARACVSKLVSDYRVWIGQQASKVPTSPESRRQTGTELLERARYAADRIQAGIGMLDDPIVLEAFRISNRAMAEASRRRTARAMGLEPGQADPPRWRPFQLAFILMNLPGIVDPRSQDREAVDLLFFPTGGGKTEAYLGLAAFTLVLRRLRNPGITSAGVSVLMRYTLRLLTLDQLSRAAALICALELERRKDTQKLGEWPFEIGLWVGRAATPNEMGAVGDSNQTTARAKTIAYLNDDRKPSPIPLEECPWCGEKFSRFSFKLVPEPRRPINLVVTCMNRRCDFSRDVSLPILGVDEPIYRRLPCFLIATVDKFAAMPWTGQVGAFFGLVDRYDSDGFYGPCDPGRGKALSGALPAPDLVIQDELHLISGPLGTMVGLYESALDELCTRTSDGHRVRPKIIASTATVRRADSQVRALFDRPIVDIFPPPGPDRRHSFFAFTQSPAESNARLYLGLAAQGQSPKKILLRSYLALLGAAQKLYLENGGKRNKQNPADPYMTLVGYFNSLRELGGSRRIVEDEVSTRLTGYSKRKRVGEAEGLFADRKIATDMVELTSRVSTNKVAEAKTRLALPFWEDERVDVAIATNMISVGLDIIRLGLMVVFGQPKTCSEYIQATSRVGRDSDRPALVLTLFNINRPRDRSHYERFSTFHDAFYRGVEATSVTPFSPRALDRGLAGTAVALARHGVAAMTPPKGAGEAAARRTELGFVATALCERAKTHKRISALEAEALGQRVRDRVRDLLDEWAGIAGDFANQGTSLQYQREVGGAQRLLYEFLAPELSSVSPRFKKFRANRSMRDVEPSVNLWVKTMDGVDLEEEGDE